jgi:hypothetical protein
MILLLQQSAAAAEGDKNRGELGLKEKGIRVVCSCPQLDSQRALCLLEPFMKLQNIGP